MGKEDLLLLIANAIAPGWFFETAYDDFWQCERHPLDNYQRQYEGYRERALRDAEHVLEDLDKAGLEIKRKDAE